MVINSLITQVAWTGNWNYVQNSKINLPVGNAVRQGDEPLLDTPFAVWPLLGDLVTIASLAAMGLAPQGDIRIPDRDAGVIKRIAVKRGILPFEPID